MIEITLPKLYGVSSSGKTKEWYIGTEESDVVISHGYLGGKIQESRTTSVGKNIGKANETSPSEQAILESKSKWNKQVDKGYSESKSTITLNSLPNLAHSYQKRGHDIVWPCHKLTKLDGVRCSIFYKGGEIFFQTRGGKAYPVIQEIADELDMVFFNNEYDKGFKVVDGELYSHGMYLEDITSCVKKHNSNTAKIKFYVFDIINRDYPDQTWKSRNHEYETLLEFNEGDLKRVFPVLAEECKDEKSMLYQHKIAVANGYEGLILRNLNGVHRFDDRTVGIIKYKERKVDDEYKVVGYTTDKKGCLIPICEVCVEMGEQASEDVYETFKAPLIGTKQWQQGLAIYFDTFGITEEYQWLTVEYEKLSKYGIPAKPKGKCFREVKNGKVQT